MWWLIGIGAVVVLIIIWYVATYNKLVSSRQVVDESFSGMDVYLKKRYDLIPNLVETVKGYAKHESETLENVVRARGEAMTGAASGDMEKQIAGEKKFETAVNRLMLLAEQYPDLKANSQFLDLQQQLQTVETDIAQSRKYYNGAVRQLNTMIRKIPSNIVASIGGFKESPYFEVSDTAERENVKVSF